MDNAPTKSEIAKSPSPSKLTRSNSDDTTVRATKTGLPETNGTGATLTPISTSFESETSQNLQEIGGVLLDNGYFDRNFKIIEDICSGGHGDVKECESENDGKLYAVKTISFNYDESLPMSEDVKKLVREVSIMKDLKSDHLVRHERSWIERRSSPNSRFLHEIKIQMELCRYDLAHFRKKYKKLKDTRKLTRALKNAFLECSLRLLGHVAQGLCDLHSIDAIHRDIKLKNCFIGLDSNGKLADFGLSRFMPEDLRKLSPVGHGCQSPEQRRHNKRHPADDFFVSDDEGSDDDSLVSDDDSFVSDEDSADESYDKKLDVGLLDVSDEGSADESYDKKLDVGPLNVSDEGSADESYDKKIGCRSAQYDGDAIF
jgi:serine/threonine protein kinase